MKKLLVTMMAGMMVAGLASVYAGGACCPAKKDAANTSAAAPKAAGCGEVFSKLNLTDDQKAKIAALKAECDKTECTETSRTKYMTGLKGILTAEQLEQCKAECAKHGKADCPMMSSAKSDKSS